MSLCKLLIWSSPRPERRGNDHHNKNLSGHGASFTNRATLRDPKELQISRDCPGSPAELLWEDRQFIKEMLTAHLPSKNPPQPWCQQEDSLHLPCWECSNNPSFCLVRVILTVRTKAKRSNMELMGRKIVGRQEKDLWTNFSLRDGELSSSQQPVWAPELYRETLQTSSGDKKMFSKSLFTPSAIDFLNST